MATILMVVADKAALAAGTGDPILRDRLTTQGHTVVFASDEEAEYALPYDIGIISDSCSAATIAAKYGTVAKPFMAMEGGVWTQAAWGLSTAVPQVSVSQWDMVGSATFVAGLSGVQTILSSAQIMNFGTGLGTGAVVHARRPTSTTDMAYFTYDQGATLRSGATPTTAPHRRCAFGALNGVWGSAQISLYTMFDLAITWLIGAVPVNTSPFFNLITM